MSANLAENNKNALNNQNVKKIMSGQIALSSCIS